jgi:hypothetical protein
MGTSDTSTKFNRITAVGRAILLTGGLISFLLFLVVLYLWFRSYLIAEVVYFKPVPAPEEFASPMPNKLIRWEFQWNLASSSGKAQVVRRNLGIGEGREPKVWHLRPDDPAGLIDLRPQDPLDVDWRLGSLQYFRSDRRYISKPPMQAWVWGFLIVTVPYWLLAVLTAVLPAMATARLLRGMKQRRRIARGMCPHCGYDLRGSGGGVCPECGAKVETIDSAFRR